MNYRKLVNGILLSVGVCLIILSRFTDLSILGWIGDLALISGSIMLIRTASIEREKKRIKKEDETKQ